MKITTSIYLALLTGWMLIALSCTDEKFSLGSDLVDADAHVSSIDTCTVEMSTVMADSFKTSAQTIALVGRYRDKSFGLTTASTFISFATCGEKTLEETATFDSMTLVLNTNACYFGDTMQSFDFTIHRLKTKVTMEDNGYQYNNHKVPYEEATLGTAHFRRKPISGKRYEIRLSDKLGSEFFEKVRISDTKMDDAYFYSYFQGLALVPSDKETGAIAGFNVTDTMVHIELYYHYIDVKKVNTSFSFAVGTDTEKTGTPLLQFNNIAYDWTSLPLAKLSKNNRELKSTDANNQVYVSNLHGLSARFKFPYLRQLSQLANYSEITSALITLKPVNGTYSVLSPLPSALNFYITGSTNDTTGFIHETSSTTTAQTGSLTTDYTYGINTHYSFDITTYLQTEILNFGVFQENLQLVIPSTTAIQTAVFGDTKNSLNALKVKLYFMSYDGSFN